MSKPLQLDQLKSGDRWPWVLNGTESPQAPADEDRALVESAEWLSLLTAAHPSSEELADLAEGLPCADSVAEHVAQCATCRALAHPEWRSSESSSAAATSSRNLLDEHTASRGSRSTWIAAAAAVMLVSGIAYVAIGLGDQQLDSDAVVARAAVEDASRIHVMTFEDVGVRSSAGTGEEGLIASMTFEASEALSERSGIEFRSSPR